MHILRSLTLIAGFIRRLGRETHETTNHNHPDRGRQVDYSTKTPTKLKIGNEIFIVLSHVDVETSDEITLHC